MLRLTRQGIVREGFKGRRDAHSLYCFFDIFKINKFDSVGKSLVVESEAVLHKSA